MQLLTGGVLGAAVTALPHGMLPTAPEPVHLLDLTEADIALAAATADAPASAVPRGKFATEAACRAAIRRLRRGAGVTYGVGVHDAVTGRRFIYDPVGSWEMASTVKVDLLLGVLRRARVADRPLTARELTLARAMIISSDNRAASRLWAANGGADGMLRLWRRFGLTGMRPGRGGSWGLSRTAIRDRLRLLEILVDGHAAIDAERANGVIVLMRDVRSGQRWGVGGVARAGEMVEVKNGWLPRSTDGRRWIINTAGRIHRRKASAPGGRIDIRLVVLSRGHASMPAGVDFVERVLATARRSLGV